MQFHSKSMWMRDDSSSELEKGSQSLPGGMRVVWRKIVVARPHHQIGKRELADGHDLVFPVIQLIHYPLVLLQVFQCPQNIALLMGIPLTLGIVFVALV